MLFTVTQVKNNQRTMMYSHGSRVPLQRNVAVDLHQAPSPFVQEALNILRASRTDLLFRRGDVKEKDSDADAAGPHDRQFSLDQDQHFFQKQLVTYSSHVKSHALHQKLYRESQVSAQDHLCMIKCLFAEIQRYNLSDSSRHANRPLQGSLRRASDVGPHLLAQYLRSDAFRVQSRQVLIRHFGTVETPTNNKNKNSAIGSVLSNNNNKHRSHSEVQSRITNDGYHKALKEIQLWQVRRPAPAPPAPPAYPEPKTSGNFPTHPHADSRGRVD